MLDKKITYVVHKYSIWTNNAYTESDHEKKTNPNWRTFCILQNVNVMKEKDRLKSCSRLKETWQVPVIHDGNLCPALEGESTI